MVNNKKNIITKDRHQKRRFFYTQTGEWVTNQKTYKIAKIFKM